MDTATCYMMSSHDRGKCDIVTTITPLHQYLIFLNIAIIICKFTATATFELGFMNIHFLVSVFILLRLFPLIHYNN